MKKLKEKNNNIVDGTYSYKKSEECGLVLTNTCTDIEKKCRLSIPPAGEKKKNIKERLLEWCDKHKLICNIVSGAIVIAIVAFAIVFAVHSCNNNPSSDVETTVSTSSSSTQATTVAATTKPKATENTTVQPTTTKPQKENSVTTNNNNNNSNNSSGNSNEFGKGGGSSYSGGKTVSDYDTHEKDKDMSNDKDSNKDEGIIGGNEGYGANISSDKESPSPGEEFEEEHTLPPTISQEKINKCPTVPLTTRTTTADNQAE